MSMTSRARVRTALSHKEPDRAPFSWGFGPTYEMSCILREQLAAMGVNYDRLRLETDDILRLNPRYVGPKLPPHTDIWGIRYQPTRYPGGAYEQIEYKPLAGTERVERVLRHPWPNPEWYDYESFASEIDAARALHGEKAVMVTAGNPFEIYCWMTGLEEALINLIVQPEIVRCAMAQICGFFLRRLERIAEAVGDRIDLWFFADDLGGQNGLLLSRTAYRRVLQPFHRTLFSAARRLTPDAFIAMHTDGAVFEIVPDLLDAGMEVLEAVQVDCLLMEPERLAAAYGDRLSFHGGVSVQKLLPFADPQTVTRECQRLLRTLGAGGGYIIAPTHAIQVHTPVANVLAMLRSVLGEEEYVRAIAASAL